MLMTPEIKLIIIIAICGAIGSTVRLLHEMQKQKIPLVKILYIYFCSITILLAIWYAPPLFGWEQSKVFLSIIGGIISVDVVELFITQGSTWISKFIKKKLNIDNDGD